MSVERLYVVSRDCDSPNFQVSEHVALNIPHSQFPSTYRAIPATVSRPLCQSLPPFESP